jgi:hypothetical protein
MKKILLIYAATLPLLQGIAAQEFDLIANGTGASLCYKGSEPVVQTAIGMLIADSKLVCKNPFTQTDSIAGRTVVVGIPDRDPALRALLTKHGVSWAGVQGRWEAFLLHAVEANGSRLLFVVGSDPRGAAYGLLELSRRMGVTPWVWWADVTPEKKDFVRLIVGGEVHAPSVQYRGVFINDEDWGMMPWSSRTFEPSQVKGQIGTKTYAKICELLLRLRANTLWPAMHECTVPFYFTEGNRDVAAKYGIVLGTSHCEPLMRNNAGEWDAHKYGRYNFVDNRKNVLAYWAERLSETAETENIYTLGMRGVHDGRMEGVGSVDEETNVLQQVVEAQRALLAEKLKTSVADVPQVFIPYKEVLKAYDNGLRLPDDVTLVWCDDNHGHITRLSNLEEQKRTGGAGVYYHVSYWGKPHDYLWLASTQPGLIYAEMKRAWDSGARRLWILNAGDIKPAEYLTEFFLDMAWNVEAFSGSAIYAHLKGWVNAVFGGAASDSITAILKEYYRLTGQRKPEHMGWNRVEDKSAKNRGGLTPVSDTELSPRHFGDEVEQRIRACREAARRSKDIYEHSIPPRLKAAYFQLVHYPVCANAAMSCKALYAQKSRLHVANGNMPLAGCYAHMATAAYNEIAALDYAYNKDMLGGKWDLMMDMKPRDLPVFQPPILPAIPAAYLEPTNYPPDQAESGAPPRDKALHNRYAERDQMIALNASDCTNAIRMEIIEGLGHSGSAVRLPQAKELTTEHPHLEYKVSTVSSGRVQVKVGVIPSHPLGGGDMRYAVVIDRQKPMVVSTRADFLTEKWAENVLRNQSLTVSEAHIDSSGEHTVRIYALDEDMLIDQLMLEFNPNRKHYLIPVQL